MRWPDRVSFEYAGDDRRPAGLREGRFCHVLGAPPLADDRYNMAVVETDEVWDYDDDGMDENGAPIMRPLYERYTVPLADLTTTEEG